MNYKEALGAREVRDQVRWLPLANFRTWAHGRAVLAEGLPPST